MAEAAIADYLRPSWWERLQGRKSYVDFHDDEFLVRMARDFGVPLYAMVRRLEELGYQN